MRKHVRWAALVVFAAVVGTGIAALLAAPPVSAGSGCWQVDCNICCRGAGGKVICTQRACV